MDGYMDIWMTDGWMDEMEEWMDDERVNGWMTEEWMGGWKSEWMDG